MGKIHFIRVDTHMDPEERGVFAAQIKDGLAAYGRPNDKVFLLHAASWLGSVDIDDEAVRGDHRA